MEVRTVQCECGYDLYMGGRTAICPYCKNKIHLVNNEPYMYLNNVPVLTTFKFHPSTLKYFDGEYPKDGEEILHIYEDNSIEIIFWEDSFIWNFENNKEFPMPFSWKSLDKK